MKQKRHIKLYEDFVRKDNEIKEEDKTNKKNNEDEPIINFDEDDAEVIDEDDELNEPINDEDDELIKELKRYYKRLKK